MGGRLTKARRWPAREADYVPAGDYKDSTCNSARPNHGDDAHEAVRRGRRTPLMADALGTLGLLQSLGQGSIPWLATRLRCGFESHCLDNGALSGCGDSGMVQWEHAANVWRAQERVRYPLFGRKAGYGVEAAQRSFSRQRLGTVHELAADPNSSGRTLNAIRHLSVGKPGRDGKPCGERPRESVPCSGSWSGDSAGLLNRKWWVRFPHRAFGSAPRRLMRVSDNQPPRG